MVGRVMAEVVIEVSEAIRVVILLLSNLYVVVVPPDHFVWLEAGKPPGFDYIE